MVLQLHYKRSQYIPLALLPLQAAMLIRLVITQPPPKKNKQDPNLSLESTIIVMLMNPYKHHLLKSLMLTHMPLPIPEKQKIRKPVDKEWSTYIIMNSCFSENNSEKNPQPVSFFNIFNGRFFCWVLGQASWKSKKNWCHSSYYTLQLFSNLQCCQQQNSI